MGCPMAGRAICRGNWGMLCKERWRELLETENTHWHRKPENDLIIVYIAHFPPHIRSAYTTWARSQRKVGRWLSSWRKTWRVLLTGVGTGLGVQEHVRKMGKGFKAELHGGLHSVPRHGQAGLGRPRETTAEVTPRSRRGLPVAPPHPGRGTGALEGGGGAVPQGLSCTPEFHLENSTPEGTYQKPASLEIVHNCSSFTLILHQDKLVLHIHYKIHYVYIHLLLETFHSKVRVFVFFSFKFVPIIIWIFSLFFIHLIIYVYTPNIFSMNYIIV